MIGPSGQAALLGFLQGLTEFLPVSSSGHLALSEILFGLEVGGLTLNVMLHAGTLLATAVVLRRRLAVMLSDTLDALRAPSRALSTPGGRDVLTVALATLPTAAIGLALRNVVEAWTHSSLAVGLGFCVTSFFLLSTIWARGGSKDVPSLLGSVLIGVIQGIAVVPGISRSGSTIAVALWLGVRPERAFELSMLMSLPVVLGAVVLELPNLAGQPGAIAPAAIGALVAFGVGWVALLLLRRVVIRGHFAWFALWVLPLAAATLALARAWPDPG